VCDRSWWVFFKYGAGLMQQIVLILKKILRNGYDSSDQDFLDFILLEMV
jgi:hypothetical protein